MSSDPMGTGAGRVLLNGNAETVERFCTLAHSGAGPSRHRDPLLRAQDRVLIVTTAWGRGERDDAPLRRHFAALGRGHGGRFLDNLLLGVGLRTVLREREVVRALYAEHEHAWNQLFAAYSEENLSTVELFRSAWRRARDEHSAASVPDMLLLGDRLAGPPTHPVDQLVERSLSEQMRRHVRSLIEADDRHAETLRQLWEHFHDAAGLEHDSLWHELRAELVNKLLNASLVALVGGEPIHILTALRFFRLGPVFNEALRRGTHFFGSSAGAMALGRRVVIFHELREPRTEFQLLDRGADLVRGVQIFPHVQDRVQTDDPANLAYLAARFHGRACVGLNAGSTLALEPDHGRWRAWSAGDADVVIFGRNGDKIRYAPGDGIVL